MTDREKVIKGLVCCCSPTTYDCTNRCPYASLYEPGNGYKNCMAALLPDALELLKEQPKQKHGHWKGFTQSRYFGMDDCGEPIFRDGLFYVCSECRLKSIIKYPYCPRCGAKMNEEVKQNE